MPKFRLMTAILVLFAITFVTCSPVFSQTSTEQGEQKAINLTEAQKQELAALQKDILSKNKQVIAKYVEFGVLTKEQGEKLSKHLDEYYNKLEKNGFIPPLGKKRPPSPIKQLP